MRDQKLAAYLVDGILPTSTRCYSLLSDSFERINKSILTVFSLLEPKLTSRSTFSSLICLSGTTLIYTSESILAALSWELSFLQSEAFNTLELFVCYNDHHQK